MAFVVMSRGLSVAEACSVPNLFFRFIPHASGGKRVRPSICLRSFLKPSFITFAFVQHLLIGESESATFKTSKWNFSV